jgi:hypothetical protein
MLTARLQAWLTARRTSAVLLLTAGAIGAMFAWYLLGWGGINGTGAYWQTNHNDSVQSIAGLRYYLHEGWGWPLLQIHSYGVPDGTNLILTDSIPLLAVPAKLVRSVLPAGFHYFGYWLALCFIMQAVAVVALLAAAGWRSLTAVLVGSGMALLQTSLLLRFFHAALVGQFLILLAFLAGIRVAGSARPLRAAWWLVLLLFVTFFVHPYLFAMVIVIALAFVADAARRRATTWLAAAGWMVGVLAGTAALLLTSGLGSVGTESAGGFGHFSMNLVALITREPDATGGQYEGFSYLGLGVILLLAIGVYASRAELGRLLSRHALVVAAVLLMALYAISSMVFFGDRLLVELPVFAPVSWLTDRFRSSGRFVWPLVYGLVVVSVLVTHRRFGQRIALLLLFGALFIQIADERPTVGVVRDALHDAEPQVLDTPVWSQLVADHTLVRMTPHQCVLGTGDPSFASREVQRLAAAADVPITTSAAARRDEPCNDAAFDLPLAAGELRVMWKVPGGPAALPGLGATCVEFDLGEVCSDKQSDRSLLEAIATSP